MDFVKKILHQISRKSEAVSQITFDEDYNVPDARPDVGRMIQKKGEVTIGDVQISEGKARVFGGLTFHLLYVSDGERRRICQLSGELPIDETIHLDGLTGGDKVCITWEVEDLNLHLINSRKLGVRAIVTLHAWIEELCDLAVPMEIRGESDVAVKRQEYRVVELAVQKKDVLRVKKELTIPSGKPELHEILWQDLEVRGLDLRSEEGRGQCAGRTLCLLSVQRRRGGSPAAVGGAGAPVPGRSGMPGLHLRDDPADRKHTRPDHTRNPARFRRRGAGPAGGGRTRT